LGKIVILTNQTIRLWQVTVKDEIAGERTKKQRGTKAEGPKAEKHQGIKAEGSSAFT